MLSSLSGGLDFVASPLPPEETGERQGGGLRGRWERNGTQAARTGVQRAVHRGVRGRGEGLVDVEWWSMLGARENDIVCTQARLQISVLAE